MISDSHGPTIQPHISTSNYGYEIPTKAPVFTTPTLDFTRHSSELMDLVDKLYTFRNSMQSRMDTPLYFGKDAERVVEERESQIIWLRDQTLSRFNQLTTPPMKRRANKKNTLAQEEKTSTNATCTNLLMNMTTHAFDPTLSTNQKAMYHYIRGRVLDVQDTKYCKFAEEDLSKSVKLNPKHDLAWNALGECLWKKGDYTKSISCFKAALQVKRSRDTLLNLAQAYRLEASKASDKVTFQKKMDESISLCKESLLLNIQDGKSWSGLGNCYITQFFKSSRDAILLQKTLKMFEKAIQNDFRDADMLRNRAVINQYLEFHFDAIQDYTNAARMDPSFSRNCQESIDSITSNALAMKEAIQKKAAQARIKELQVILPQVFSNFTPCGFQDLQPGVNNNKYLKIRMVTELPHYFARAYIGDDGQGKVGGILFYNIPRDIVNPNDIVLIVNPVYTLVNWSFNNIQYEYNMVRVEDPSTFVVNGQFLKSNQVQMTTISFQ